MAHFERGAVMRTPCAEVRAGGKGIDLARVLHSLGKSAPLLLLLGDLDGEQFSSLLRQEGLKFTSTSFKGSVRVATMYHEDHSPVTTIVNEEGPSITKEEWRSFLSKIEEKVKPDEIIASMGSFPSGVNEEEIAELIDLAHKKKNLIFFDTAPHTLAWALKHGADIVSPNLDEAEAVINGSSEDLFSGESSNGEARAESAALSLCALGAKVAIVHAGALGSALAYKGKTIFLHAADVSVKRTVGAGDAMAAGFILNCEGQAGFPDLDQIDWKLALQYGSATAGASCEMGRSGDVDPVRVAEIFARIVALCA